MSAASKPRKRSQRAGLFLGYWFDQAGHRLRRVKRAELGEAYRLLREHGDIARGKPVRVGPDPGLSFGDRMPLG